MLLPCQSPGGRVVGIITLHDDSRSGNNFETGSRLVSLLRDFAAHVAIAVQSVHGRRRAAFATLDVQRRLDASRRRASLILCIEKLWSNSSNTKDVFDLFGRESLSNIFRKTSVHQANMYIVQRAGHENSGQLWTYLKNSNERVFLGSAEGSNSEKHRLLNSVLMSGEPRRSGRYVCVVARKESGHIMSLAVAECEHAQEDDDSENEQEGLASTNRLLSSGPRRGKRLRKGTMTMEEEAMFTMWCKHCAMAVRHFETLEQCIDGMADASSALMALQDQLKETKEAQRTHSIAIHRFHIAATAGIDVFANIFQDDFVHRSLNNIGQIGNENAFNLILKIEENATRLLAASSAIVLLRGEDISSKELLGIMSPGNDLYDDVTIEERMGESFIGRDSSTEANAATHGEGGARTSERSALSNYYKKKIVSLDEKDLPFVFQIMQNNHAQRHLIKSNSDIDAESAFGTLWNARVMDPSNQLGIEGPYQVMGVPILSSRNVAFGVILVIRGGLKSQTEFNSGDMDMLMIYSRLCLNAFLYQRRLEEYDRNVKGMAMRNTMKMEQNHLMIKHSKRHFEILKFTVSLTKHRSVHTLLQRATEQVARLLNCDLVNIYLFDAKKQQLVLLDNGDQLPVDPNASTAISRSVFCSGVVEVTRADEEDHNTILSHLSPSLKSWYNKIERITCVRIGVDLYKTGRLNEHDEKSKLVDDVLGK